MKPTYTPPVPRVVAISEWTHVVEYVPPPGSLAEFLNAQNHAPVLVTAPGKILLFVKPR